MNLITDTIQTFPTFEMREAAFRGSVAALLPRSHAGPGAFWKDFSRIIGTVEDHRLAGEVAYVTANPRDCLAFSTPRQVLMAARMQGGGPVPGRSPKMTVPETARKFNLDRNLDQPIRTLSGGETVRLALAKVYALSAAVGQLAMASPFCWLDRESRGCLDCVLSAYRQREIPVSLFTLDGEEDTRQLSANEDLGPDWQASEPFQLTAGKVRLTLGSPLTAFDLPPPEVRVDDFNADLSSPCLWVGGNGMGKSLLARVLAAAIPHQGEFRIINPTNKNSIRLIFQDVNTQTLMRSFNMLGTDSDHADTVDIYRRMISMYNDLDQSGSVRPSGPGDDALPTIFETKAMLVAVRLARLPGALILDEPDWGLSRTAAVAFVGAVVNVAHQLNVPVILITHKPWWHRVVGSRLKIRKTRVEMAGGRVAGFHIQLKEYTDDAS